MKNRLYLVDTFTNMPFSGNPACVVIMTDEKGDEWMQQVAFEMGLSVSAFLWRSQDSYFLRWFTPKKEMEVSFHATLATAHILWETKTVAVTESISFETRSGLLTASKRGQQVEMGFPALRYGLADFPLGIIAALQVTPKYVGTFDDRLLIEIEKEEDLVALKPDFTQLMKYQERGVVITSGSKSEEIDFVSRYFAPWDGVDEDPVTGTTHCCLGPYWSKRLGKKELRAYQAPSRGGYVNMRVEKDRVFIASDQVTIFEGTILI